MCTQHCHSEYRGCVETVRGATTPSVLLEVDLTAVLGLWLLLPKHSVTEDCLIRHVFILSPTAGVSALDIRTRLRIAEAELAIVQREVADLLMEKNTLENNAKLYEESWKFAVQVSIYLVLHLKLLYASGCIRSFCDCLWYLINRLVLCTLTLFTS